MRTIYKTGKSNPFSAGLRLLLPAWKAMNTGGRMTAIHANETIGVF